MEGLGLEWRRRGTPPEAESVASGGEGSDELRDRRHSDCGDQDRAASVHRVKLLLQNHAKMLRRGGRARWGEKGQWWGREREHVGVGVVVVSSRRSQRVPGFVGSA